MTVDDVLGLWNQIGRDGVECGTHWGGGEINVYTKCIYNFYWEILGQEISREI